MSEKEKKVFATLFTDMWNIQLIKDPGMIPLTFNNFYGYKSIIPIFAKREYPYKEVYFNDIEMPVLCGNKSQFARDISRIKWLIKNAKKIDVLNLFFFYRGTWLLMWLYKKLNHKGLIYIHLDSDGERLLNYEFSKTPIKRFIVKKIFLGDTVINDTFWGLQNSKNAKKLQGNWPFLNLQHIPNGVFWENEKKCNYKDKKNVILTVGRIGSPEKNNEMLMEAFAKVADEFQDWKLRLVGPIEDKFTEFIKEFFERYPNMECRIEFAGPIFDREKLEIEYNKAKIFCLPSLWEGFSLVGVEALSKGCYILGSDIASNIEVTQNGEMGCLFRNNNLEDFVDKMKYCISNEDVLKENFNKSIEYANNHYTWRKAVEPVAHWIENKMY